MDKEKDPENILERLKGDYKNGLVSALVGAGFSKNVSNHFLSWGELLCDMVEELYAIDIKKEYNNYLLISTNVPENHMGEKDFKEEYIKDLLKKENYLELVSNYIKHKGYRESVEVYIEERIPYADFKEDNIILKLGNTEEVINKKYFSAHKALLEADRLQNIYTTNYDNLLEFTLKLLQPGVRNMPNIVYSGKDLSNKIKNRNIIKIHGNLRTKPNDKNKFDGDNKLCYIIAKEDYESYREKHEAFTSLMRISMLQGKFMLLGFSGTDPNYQGWVTWMSDVLDDEKGNPKIYIIDVSGEKIAPDLQLYYDNHYTKVVNLIEKEQLSTIGYEDKDITNIFKEYKNDNNIKRDILTKFLKYLNTDISDNTDSYNMCDGISEEKQNYDNSSANFTQLPTLWDTKTDSYAYRTLWRDIPPELNDADAVSNILNQIKEAKNKNLFPKIVYNQEYIITEITRKKRLNSNDAFLLALAIDECGLNPHYYSKVIQDYEELDKLPLWNLLKIKEASFNGDDSMLHDDSDECVYENIQRLLFHLDFEQANEQIERWTPGKGFVIQKAMRLAAINECRNAAIKYLDDYIPKETNIIARLYAMQVANYISEQYPKPYNIEEFYRYGIDGIGDNLNYMILQLRGKLKRPNVRGWIGTTTSLSGNFPEYEKSLRVLRYISDVGLYANFGHTYFVDIEAWYLVFKNLYNEFPYPCFFYSIQYNDTGVLTRIGQDFAYSPILIDFNNDILIKSIRAIGKESTPNLFIVGLLKVIEPIYMAVDEKDWFPLFKENIFNKLINEFSKADISYPLVENAGKALMSLKNPQNIKYIFLELLAHYKENHNLSDIIISNYLHIEYLNNHLTQDITDVINGLVLEYPDIDTTELLYVLNKKGILTQETKDLFAKTINSIDLEKLPQELSKLFYLCHLTKDHSDVQKKVKSLLLKQDIWYCGVKENGKSWSTPNYLRLNVIKNDIEWSSEDFRQIRENLNDNIRKFAAINDKLSNSPYGRNIQAQYLSDALRFIDGLNEERKDTLVNTKKIVEQLLQSRVSYKNLVEGILSEQSADVNSAMEDVVYGIDAKGLSAYLNEFNFILDKTIIGEGTTINSTLWIIRRIVDNHSLEIIDCKLCSKLHTLLSIYKDRWPQLQEFNPVGSFNHLRSIAVFIRDNGYKDSDAVSYWLNDSFVQRFIRE
jgi:hypothetical protein